jgi:hypothetical protein
MFNINYFFNNVISILYNIIHLYSKITILFNKYINCYLKKILDNYNKFFNNYSTIEFYNEGVLFRTNYIFKSNTTCKEKIIELKKIIEPLDYDFIIYSEKDYEMDKINKVFYSHFPQLFDYTISNIKFLSFFLYYNNTSIEIELFNQIYNYYIINNIINKQFIIYYLLNIKKMKDFSFNCFSEFKYKLQLIDHNVNILHLDETDEIIIEKKNYIIRKIKNKED